MIRSLIPGLLRRQRSVSWYHRHTDHIADMASYKRPSFTPGLPHISALTARFEAQHTKSMTHRLFYVAKISPERADCRDIPDHYERLIHKQIKSNLGESISGLLLIYPSCVIHMIESTSEILCGIIQDLVQIQNRSANSLLQDAKILVISHHIASRLLPQWYFRTVRLPVHYLDDLAHDQSVESVVEDCLSLLLKLGVFLSPILKPGCKGHGANLHDLAPELLVREERINFLIQSDRFLKPEEFLAMYYNPLNISSDSDQVWPAPQHLYL